jgi:hypothetical protein
MADQQWQVDSVTPTPQAATPPQSTPDAGQWQVDSITPTQPQPSFASRFWAARPHPIEEAKGIVKGAGQTVAGLLEQYANAPGTLPGVVPGTSDAAQMGADWLRRRSVVHNAAQEQGAIAESIAELMAAPELLPESGAGAALKLSEHLGKAAEMAKALEKFPTLHAAVKTGIAATKAAARNAIEQGTQTYLKTDDPEAATNAAIVGGATGGVLGGAAKAVGEGVNLLRPGAETLEGVEVPVAASQKPNASVVSKLASRPEDIPGLEAERQAAVPQIVKNSAQKAIKRVLDTVNETRQVLGPVDEAGNQPGAFKFSVDKYDPRVEAETPAERAATNTQREVGTMAYAVPERVGGGPPTGATLRTQQLGSLASTVPEELIRGKATPVAEKYITSDPNEAVKLLTEAQQIQRSPDLPPRLKARVDARVADLEEQLQTYHQTRATVPHFNPIDVDKAISNTPDYETAGNLIQNSVRDVYERMNAESQGEFNKIIKLPKYTPEFQEGIQKIFDANKTKFSPEEFTATTDAYRKGAALKDLHEAIQQGFNVSKEYAADTADLGGKRTFTGSQKVGNQIDDVLKERGDDLKEIIGNDGIRSLRRMNELMKGPETGDGFHKILNATAAVMRRHHGGVAGFVGSAAAPLLGVSHLTGMMGGAATGYALQRVLNRIATDPVIADRVNYAVTHKVAERIAGPLIASMMVRGTESKPVNPPVKEKPNATGR